LIGGGLVSLGRRAAYSTFRVLTADDRVLAACLAVVLFVASLFVGFPVPKALAPALLCVPLCWRSRLPIVVLGIVAIGSLAYLAWVESRPAYVPPLAVALYTAAMTGERRLTLLIGAWLVPFVAIVACFFPEGGRSSLSQFQELIVQLGFALSVGEAVRSGREALAAMRERNEIETRRRVNEERIRIARDVHDVVSHSLATISTQASVGAHIAPTAPAEGLAMLAEIRDLSNEALDGLRHTVGSLRADEDEGPIAPTPSLRDLPRIVERARGAGLSVTLRMEGATETLPSALQLGIYRIVQESLTNAIRHAHGSRVAIRISVGGQDLSVEVTDDGSGRTIGLGGDGLGSGLIGLHERAMALGGSLEAGESADGGFRVHATLPLEGGR
jgi:signal transduction histidine kinase